MNEIKKPEKFLQIEETIAECEWYEFGYCNNETVRRLAKLEQIVNFAMKVKPHFDCGKKLSLKTFTDRRTTFLRVVELKNVENPNYERELKTYNKHLRKEREKARKEVQDKLEILQQELKDALNSKERLERKIAELASKDTEEAQFMMRALQKQLPGIELRIIAIQEDIAKE